MPGKDKKRQAKITFDALRQTLSEEFAKIPDHRRANASYKRPDFLGSACARFSLKSPTANSFEEQTKVESRNLQSIYHLGAIPSDTQTRA